MSHTTGSMRPGRGNEAINLRIGPESVDELDAQALAGLRRAYGESR